MEPAQDLTPLQQAILAAEPVILGLQSLIFLVWVVLMYRNLFMLRRRAVAQTGQTFPGPVTTARTFGAFLRAPEYRRDRILLGLVTLALMAMIGLTVALVQLLPPT